MPPPSLSSGRFCRQCSTCFGSAIGAARGGFLETFVPEGGSLAEQRRKATVGRVAEKLASSDDFDGFTKPVEQAILGDMLLCFCLENTRRDLGRDKQVQRVAPTHYMASWIDLPRHSVNLRFVPETIVAMLADQKGEFVEPNGDGDKTRFTVGRRHDENLLLNAFSHGIKREGRIADLAGDRFDEGNEDIGADQLLTIRLGQRLKKAPDKVRGKDEARISNQRPLSEKAARNFSEDIRRFVRAYSGVIPRQAFVELLEACVATGMTAVLTSVVEILFNWIKTGSVTEIRDQQPIPVFVDCSNGIDRNLRGLSERSMDDLMRRIERVPEILTVLRLLDYAARDNKKIRGQEITTRPYASDWLNLLGKLFHGPHEEEVFIHRQMDDYGAKLAKEFEDDYPDVTAVLRNEQSLPNSIQRLAAALTLLMKTTVRGSTIGMVDSTLNAGRPNGLARKRRTSAGSNAARRTTRDVRSLILTDPVLEYLVHLHLLPSGSKSGWKPLSLKGFLYTIRERYGFHIDATPPQMTISNELLQSNRAILERRLRDLGLMIGVNDAESMKRLCPRFESRTDL